MSTASLSMMIEFYRQAKQKCAAFIQWKGSLEDLLFGLPSVIAPLGNQLSWSHRRRSDLPEFFGPLFFYGWPPSN